MDYFSPQIVALTVLSLMGLLLARAVWIDIHSQRIPNIIVLYGTVLGLLVNAVLPEGDGFVSVLPGALGLTKALEGWILGLALMLPLYMLRAMGAGDVKLVAMVGSILGPNAMICIVLLTFVIGGVLSLFVAMAHGTLSRMVSNLWTTLTFAYFKLTLQSAPTLTLPGPSAGKSPYSIAITLGTLTYIVLQKMGNLDFLRLLMVF